MSDLGSFSSCRTDRGGGLDKRERRLRRRAFAASALLEIAGVAILLIWPLVTLTTFPPETEARPVPLFTPIPSFEPVHEQQATSSVQTHRTIADIFHQPSRIPVRVYRSGTPNEISDNIAGDPLMRSEPGPGLPGIGDIGGARPIAPQPPPDRPRMVSRGAMDAFLVHRVQPEYPLLAKIIRLAGAVELRAVIGTDGRIRRLAVVSGNPILAQAALAAVRQWIYQPTRLSGEPVEVEAQITVNFVLQ